MQTDLTHQLWRLTRLVILLTCLTWYAGDTNFRSTPIQNSSLLAEFPGTIAMWKAMGNTDAIHFHDNAIVYSGTGSSFLTTRRDFTLPKQSSEHQYQRYFRLAGEIVFDESSSDSIQKNNLTAISLYKLQTNSPPKQFFANTFSYKSNLQHIDQLIELSDNIDRISVVWISNTSNVLTLKNLSIDIVRKSQLYTPVIVAITLLWLALTVHSMVLLAKFFSITSFLAILGAATLIISGTMLTAGNVLELFESTKHTVSTIGGSESLLPDITIVNSAIHIFFFVILTLALLRQKVTSIPYFLALIALCASIAFATESMQRHRAGRSPSIEDLLLNFSGIALAIIIWLFFKLIVRGYKESDCASR